MCEVCGSSLRSCIFKDQSTCLNFLPEVSGQSSWVGQLFLHKNEIKFSFETSCSSLVTQPSLHSDHENHSDFHNERCKLRDPPKKMDPQMLDCQEQKLMSPSCSSVLISDMYLLL